MKSIEKDPDLISEKSENSQVTNLKVFKCSTNNQLSNNVVKLSTDTKNDSTIQSTLKSERDKNDSLSLYFKDGKDEKKKILNKNFDSKFEIQKVIIDVGEEIESISMKSEKIEEFPLSFRPTGLGMKDCGKDDFNKNIEKDYNEIRKYEFLEEKVEDKSLNNFAEDFFIDNELIAENQINTISKTNLKLIEKKNSYDSIKDLVVQETLPMNSTSPKKNNIDRKQILKNLAENSFNIKVQDKAIHNFEEKKEEFKGKDEVIKDKNSKLINNMKVEINCCLSNLDRGNAIFVTNRDHIFKLPRNFLPNNYIKGNSFKISIEETEASNKKYEKIRYLQNKHLFK